MILGIGVDITEIARIAQSIEKYGDKFTGRIFSPEEALLAKDRKGQALAQFVAGRFACKEAVFKAMGTGLGDASWSEVSITNDGRGKPVASLTGVAAQRVIDMGGAEAKVHVSISHNGEHAVAQAIIEGRCQIGESVYCPADEDHR